MGKSGIESNESEQMDDMSESTEKSPRKQKSLGSIEAIISARDTEVDEVDDLTGPEAATAAFVDNARRPYLRADGGIFRGCQVKRRRNACLCRSKADRCCC